MKTKFWKHEFELLFVYPLFGIISFIIFLVGLILLIQDKSFWPLMVAGLIFLILILNVVVFNKRILSKVIFSKDNIKLERFKKEINHIDWNEITNIESIPVGKGHFYLSFVSKNKRINVDLTKKMYATIMDICPSLNIKIKINEMNEFKWFHRIKNK